MNIFDTLRVSVNTTIRDDMIEEFHLIGTEGALFHGELQFRLWKELEDKFRCFICSSIVSEWIFSLNW